MAASAASTNQPVTNTNQQTRGTASHRAALKKVTAGDDEELDDDLKALLPPPTRTTKKTTIGSSSATTSTTLARPHLQSLPRSETSKKVKVGQTEGDRHLARLAARYPSISEPQMLQDHVDKMRIRLKSLAYSLDPTGPVPEIILPERTKK